MTAPGKLAGGRWSSLRLAARLARRETSRRPWRTLLVSLLVAVPVAGMAVAAVWVRTDHQTGAESWRAQYGTADLYATPGAARGGAVEPGGPSLEELLPAGTRSVTYRSQYNRALRTTGGTRVSAEITDLPLADPLAAPIMQVTSGRAPEHSGEVFVTRAVARDLGVGPGDTVDLERPAPATWTVVGVGERRAWWDSETVVLAPGTAFPWRDDPFGSSNPTVLADLPDDVTAAQLAALSRFPEGVAFAPGLVLPGTPGATSTDSGRSGETRTVAWSWVIGAVVLTVVGIVIAAAFAAGARRQLATLGQLAANGAPPPVLRRVLFLQGTWTGLVGTVVGFGLAALMLAVGAPHADNLLNRDVDPYTLRLADLVPIAVLGVAAATIAALVPARTTARIPVMAALAGRRPLTPVPRRLTVTGVGVGAAGLGLLGLAALGANGTATSGGGGTVWVLTAVVGGVAVLLGTCAVAPGYVSVLEPLAARLRGTSRLAARSLARRRTRTGAVVSAVCATSALAVAASALLLSADAEERDPDWLRADEIQLQARAQDTVADETGGRPETPVEVPAELLAAVADAVPAGAVHRLRTVGVPGVPGNAYWEVRTFTPDGPAVDGLPVGDVGPRAGGPVGIPGGGPPSFMSGPFGDSAVVVDDTFLGLYDLPAAARRALAAEGATALASETLAGHPVTGTATVALVGGTIPESATSGAPAVEDLVGPFETTVVDSGDLALGSVPRILLTPERAQALGLQPRAAMIVVRAPGPLTGEQRSAVWDITQTHDDERLDAWQPGQPRLSVSVEMLNPTGDVNARLLEALLVAAAFVLSLFVVAVNLALAAAETRDERDVLAVVGAPPPTMRRVSGAKAGLLTVLGAALAIPVGFLPVAVFVSAIESNLPLVFPWRIAALLLVAVPILAAVTTTWFSGLALRLRPVRISTMAFD